MEEHFNESETHSANGISNDAKAIMFFESHKKSIAASYVLWFLFGLFGGHRFYLGKVRSAIGMLVLFLAALVTIVVPILLIALLVWEIVDAFLIPSMVSEKNQELIEQIKRNRFY